MKRFAPLLAAAGLFLSCAFASAAPLLIDVRTPAEFAEGHVEGAVNLPLDTITSSIAGVAPDKETPIGLYCRSGRRSADAGQKLQALGYTQVRNLGSLDDARKSASEI